MKNADERTTDAGWSLGHTTSSPLISTFFFLNILFFYIFSSPQNSADNLIKQFVPRSGPTECCPDLDPNCLTPR